METRFEQFKSDPEYKSILYLTDRFDYICRKLDLSLSYYDGTDETQTLRRLIYLQSKEQDAGKSLLDYIKL